jgi:hypothetical protein
MVSLHQIFELFMALGLPSFILDNWKSTIRKEVRVHSKYATLQPWNGAETADIVYNDTQGKLTEILTQKGYFGSRATGSFRPVYYLEVKATTKDCNEQFYMSGAQYARVSPTLRR